MHFYLYANRLDGTMFNVFGQEVTIQQHTWPTAAQLQCFQPIKTLCWDSSAVKEEYWRPLQTEYEGTPLYLICNEFWD